MATTIVTGRDLSLTLDADVYDAQASSVVLELTNEQQQYEVIDGTAYKTTKTTGTITVEMYQDWNAAGSLCEALWNAANSAPDTALAFSFVANTGATFTGNCYPAFPAAGGSAPDAITTTVQMVTKDGDVTLA